MSDPEQKGDADSPTDAVADNKLSQQDIALARKYLEGKPMPDDMMQVNRTPVVQGVQPPSHAPAWLSSSLAEAQKHWSELVMHAPPDPECMYHTILGMNRGLTARNLDVFSFRDALVAYETSDRRWVVTSPNMSWVPSSSEGRITVRRRTDGHFGAHDPIRWP